MGNKRDNQELATLPTGLVGCRWASVPPKTLTAPPSPTSSSLFFLLISTIMTDQRQNNEKIAAMTSQPLNRAVSDGYLTAMQTWTFSVSSYSNK